jgi:hypothetical protein
MSRRELRVLERGAGRPAELRSKRFSKLLRFSERWLVAGFAIPALIGKKIEPCASWFARHARQLLIFASALPQVPPLDPNGLMFDDRPSADDLYRRSA